MNMTCYNAFDSARLDKDMRSKCLGNSNCTLSGLKSYVTAKKDVCTHEEASFFVQYYCKQNQQQLMEKFHEGTIIACVSVFCCLFFIVMNFYLRRSTEIKHVEWDVATLTAGDYAVDMKLAPQQYALFL